MKKAFTDYAVCVEDWYVDQELSQPQALAEYSLVQRELRFTDISLA